MNSKGGIILLDSMHAFLADVMLRFMFREFDG